MIIVIIVTVMIMMIVTITHSNTLTQVITLKSLKPKSTCCKRKGDAPHKVGNTIGDNDDDVDDDDGDGDLDDD